MTIHEYKKGDHPSGFQGLSVVVSINGKNKQKYFPFHENKKPISHKKKSLLRKSAKKLDKKWRQEQKEARQQRIIQAKGLDLKNSVGATGVMCISLRYRAYNRRCSQSKQWYAYYYPMFRVHIVIDHKVFRKDLYINSLGYGEAWTQAVKFLAEKKKIKNYNHLLKRIPPITQLNKIKRYMRKQGHDI